MEWLVLWFSLEAGVSLFGDYQIFEETQEYQYFTNQPIYIEFNPEIEIYDNVRIYGVARFDMYLSKENPGFLPVNFTSIFGVELYFNKLTIGYRHSCGHGAIPWGKIIYLAQEMNHFYDQLYIRFTNKE